MTSACFEREIRPRKFLPLYRKNTVKSVGQIACVENKLLRHEDTQQATKRSI